MWDNVVVSKPGVTLLFETECNGMQYSTWIARATLHAPLAAGFAEREEGFSEEGEGTTSAFLAARGVRCHRQR